MKERFSSDTDLVPLLKYGRGKNKEDKRMMEDAYDKIEDDSKREYLDSAAQEDGVLIQEAVRDEILAGAEPRAVMRDVLPFIEEDSGSLRWVKSGASGYAEQVAEGTAPDVSNQSFENKNLNLKRYAFRPVITKRLVQESEFDMIAFRLRQAGRAIENALNREALKQLVTNRNSTTSVAEDSSGSMTLADVAETLGTVKQNLDVTPNNLVLDAYSEAQLLDESNFLQAQQFGDREVLETGNIPGRVLGMDVFTCTATVGASTPESNYWMADQNTSSVKALLIDTDHPAAAIAGRPVEITQYDDPIRGLDGIIAEMFFDVKVLENSAFGAVMHS